MDERRKVGEEVVCQGKNMEEKLSKKRKKTTAEYTVNEGDHSIVIEEEQSKKMKTKKILSKENKRTHDEKYETNVDNPDLAKSNVVDPPLEKSNEDEDQSKKMKKKKMSKESKHKEYSESKSNECKDDDKGKKMKKKLAEESKLKEYNDTVKKMKTEKIPTKKKKRAEDDEHETNGGNPYLAKSNVVDQPLVRSYDDQHLVKINEGGDDGQGKKMKKEKKKKKKLNEESQHQDCSEFKSNECEDDDQSKKKKKKKKLTEEDGNQSNMPKKKKKKLSHKSKSNENCEFNSNEGDPPLARITEVIDQGKKMKKKKKAKAVMDEYPNPSPDRTSKPKRVTFSDQVEVCCDGLVRGKRFTPEEDEKLKVAIYDYIESHGLGDEGLHMILNCSKYPKIRGCWKEINEALPNRPKNYVYERAHVLFEKSKVKWTPEELHFIIKAHEQHGPDWRSIAEALGKSRYQVKDAWRRLKFPNVNKGHWSQEEYQTLFDLVNLDLRVRAKETYRKSNHGMLRDNICWEAIAHKLSTRNSSYCCKKWYEQLVSPMVAKGEWCDTDDYRMLDALYTLDACNMEEVDWDNLVEDRSGDVCRKRWGQLVHHIGQHVGKSFSEQVEILAKRYCPDLLEAREAFDAKPVIC